MRSAAGALGSSLALVLGLQAHAARAESPEAVPYQDGDARPDGYRLEQRPRQGLIKAGLTVFGVSYLVAAIAPTFRDGSRWLYLPLAGPLLAMRGDARRASSLGEDGFGESLWLTEALQVGGVVMFVSAFVFPSPWWVRERVEVRVGPSSVAIVGAF